MLKRLFYIIVHQLRTKDIGWKSIYEINIPDSIAFMNRIKEPIDDIERSYAQYRCQCYLMSNMAVFLYNLVSFFLILPYIIKCYLTSVKRISNVDIVYTISIKDKSIVPSSLRDEFTKEIITGVYEGFKLNKYDLKFILKLWKRYPFSFFFVHRMIFKISIYRYFIEKYNPKAIAINSEYSSTSSAMTLYCESQNINHINLMHGEKLLNIRDSFFRFSRCYVWDDYYISLFKRLRAANGQFIVERPHSLIFNVNTYKGVIPHCDYKYMLFENKKLNHIRQIVSQLKNKGFKVKVRPHPSYTDMQLLKKLFNEDDIEDTNISIQASVANTENVISLVSTVLLQAYFSNINVVIDDVVYKEEYSKLEELGYILLNKKIKKLSVLLSHDQKNN